MMWRRVEIEKGGEWVEVQRGEVKQGDRFRMFNPDGSIVSDLGGKTNWVAAKDSVPTDPPGNFAIEVEK